jgi:hypothetical protein
VTRDSAADGKPVRPPAGRKRWTSFIAEDAEHRGGAKPIRGLHEATNPQHRLRVEHDAHTLLIHLSGEDGTAWTTMAVDRATRRWAVAQDERQADAARRAYDALYGESPPK